MLRITKQSDYAVVLMSRLAEHDPEERIAARDLSERTHIPLPMVAKILKQLSREGLVDSTRGAHGGYALARPADDISLAELLQALEGPVGITECTIAGEHCSLESRCRTRTRWAEINDQIRGLLESVSLSEMTGPAERSITMPTPPLSEETEPATAAQ